MNWRSPAAVAVGSAIGAVLRQIVSDLYALVGAPLLWGTLTVNVLGSLAIGWLAALTVAGGRLPLTDGQRLFLMGGICGGFTTFSVFSLDTLELLQTGAWSTAAINTGATVLLCLVAVWTGFTLGSRMNRRSRY